MPANSGRYWSRRSRYHCGSDVSLMNEEHLRTYLSDHLAGSVGAVELLKALIHDGAERPRAAEFRSLLTEIDEDRSVLKDLLHRLSADESPIKNAGAWLTEKALRPKTSSDSPLGLLEALEVLSLGIEGKLRLWQVLAVADWQSGLDLTALEQRARDQITRVEAMRLDAARAAFSARE